jgi:hypothetical protein
VVAQIARRRELGLLRRHVRWFVVVQLHRVCMYATVSTAA